MAAFLTYSEVDTGIQEKMSNQSPDSTKRLNAINEVMQDLYTEYDIESSKREVVLYIVPDGTPINLENEISSNDFKRAADLRYLADNKQRQEFNLIDDDLFNTRLQNGVRNAEYTVTYNNGNLFMKVNSDGPTTPKLLHNMGDLTSNGTWAVSGAGDATDLTTSTVTTLNQVENIQFDIDVSQSANNYGMIVNSTMDVVDVDALENLGRIKYDIFIPNITNFTSVEIRWGNGAAAYWSDAVTTQADGSNFVVGWNTIEHDWNNATETGTVDNTEIDYLAVKVNYAAGYVDTDRFRVEAIKIYQPLPMKLVYFTYFDSQTTAGVFQQDLTDTASDELLIPRRYKSLMIYGALVKLWPMSMGDDAAKRASQSGNKYNSELIKLGLDIGKQVKVPTRKMKPRNPLM